MVASLDIGFNSDASQEIQGSLQVDYLANERPAGNKIQSEEESRRTFTLSTQVLLPT